MLKLAVNYAITRLQEPTTYAGLAALLLAHHIADAQVWASMIQSVGIGIAGAAAIFVKEKGGSWLS